MGAGFVSFKYASSFDKPVLLVGAMVLMATAHAVLALPPKLVLWPGCMLSSFAYGNLWALTPVTITVTVTVEPLP
jgi:hypothetical protein